MVSESATGRGLYLAGCLIWSCTARQKAGNQSSGCFRQQQTYNRFWRSINAIQLSKNTQSPPDDRQYEYEINYCGEIRKSKNLKVGQSAMNSVYFEDFEVHMYILAYIYIYANALEPKCNKWGWDKLSRWIELRFTNVRQIVAWKSSPSRHLIHMLIICPTVSRTGDYRKRAKVFPAYKLPV